MNIKTLEVGTSVYDVIVFIVTVVDGYTRCLHQRDKFGLRQATAQFLHGQLLRQDRGTGNVWSCLARAAKNGKAAVTIGTRDFRAGCHDRCQCRVTL